MAIKRREYDEEMKKKREEELVKTAEKEKERAGGIPYDEWYAKNKHKKLPTLKEKLIAPYPEHSYEGTLTFEAWLQQKYAQKK